jgi:hypothetical protein
MKCFELGSISFTERCKTKRAFLITSSERDFFIDGFLPIITGSKARLLTLYLFMGFMFMQFFVCLLVPRLCLGMPIERLCLE